MDHCVVLLHTGGGSCGKEAEVVDRWVGWVHNYVVKISQNSPSIVNYKPQAISYRDLNLLLISLINADLFLEEGSQFGDILQRILALVLLFPMHS